MKNAILILVSLTISAACSMAQAVQAFPELGSVPQQALSFTGGEEPSSPITPTESAVQGETEIISVASGPWGDPATWDCDCIPFGNVDVVIDATHEVLLNADVEIVNLTIAPAARLEMPSGLLTVLSLEGDFDCQGMFAAGSGEVRFAGTYNHQIIGETDFNILRNAGAGEVHVLGETGILSTLFVGNATFYTNDRVTLKSTSASQSAALAPLNGEHLIGTLTYERRINSTANGWLTLGSAVSDATLTEINDNFVTTGFPGANFPTNPFVSIRTYFEPAGPSEAAFLPVSDVNDAFNAGVGYYVYANAGNYLFDVTGTPNTGLFIFPISFTDHDTPLQDGLNVLSNPYPADIDWSKESAWLKSGMRNTLYIWDVGLGRFRTFANGYGVNGGLPIIRGGEAFWVHAWEPDASLRVTENAKSIMETPTVNQGNQFVMMQLSGLGPVDETIIAFDDASTTQYDHTLDAMKLSNESASSLLASQSADGITLAINHVPLSTNAIEVPILISASNGGTGTLTLTHAAELNDRCGFIEDLETGERYSLEASTAITFDIAATNLEHRFTLHVTPPIEALPSMAACYGESTGSVLLEAPLNGTLSAELINVDGTVVAEYDNLTESVIADGLPAGWYSFNVTGVELCGSLQTEVFIDEPLPIEVTTDLTELGCSEESTAQVLLEATGGTGDFNFIWENELEGAFQENLTAGTYTGVAIDENGCEASFQFELIAPTPAEAAFEVSQQIVNLQNGEATVYFTNNSVNADSFTWNFGDGGLLSNEANPEYTYTAPGNYIVSLIASNGECTATYHTVVIVEQGMNIAEKDLEGLVTVYAAEGGVIVRFDHNDLRTYRIDGFNLLGQQLMNTIESRFGAGRLMLDLPSNVPVALISIIDTETGRQHTFKILR